MTKMKMRIITAFFVISVLMSSSRIMIPSAYNVYSPFYIIQNGQLIIYVGGWMSSANIPNDDIWRGVCTTFSNCGSWKKVVSALPNLCQINDPAVVKMPAGYYIMYATGNTNCQTPDGSNHAIYFMTSWDGIIWSTPAKLIDDFWTPGVAVKNGVVYLFANTLNGPANLYRFDLGTSGVAVGTPVQLDMPVLDWYWINVDVVYQASINLYQMVGENLQAGGLSSMFVDYLYSSDGLTWTMGQHNIITAPPGGSVITPAMHPGTAYWVAFGCSPIRTGLSNNICFGDWSIP